MGKFIDKIAPAAMQAYKELGVLASLTIAQAILESASGTKSIGNNIFGIKATDSWKGKKQLVWTTEYVRGSKIKVQAWFRDYDSIDDSIKDHAKLLTLPRYKAVLAAKDYKEACIQVQKCGYATDPKYANKLIAIIEEYKLYQYDKNISVNDTYIIVDRLKQKGYITEAEYWLNVLEGKEQVNIEYLKILLQRVVS